MKIFVPVKRVLDYNVKARVKADGSGVDLTGAKMSINPFDEIAVEEAVRIAEKTAGTEVIVATIGPAAAQDVLRGALALGADRALHVVADLEIQPLAVAKLLRELVVREAPDLVVMGKQAIDDDSNQTGQMLAALLGWGQATFASKVELGNGSVTVTREVDGGHETLALTLPALVTTDLRLNEPRHLALPKIMAAKKKPLDTLDLASLGVDVAPRLKVLNVAEPPVRKGGGKVADVPALVAALKTAGVL